MARVVFAVLAIAACLFLMRDAARIGFSRLLTRYGIGAASLAAADQAVQLTPDDPDAQRARAIVLNRFHRPAEAEAALQAATSLRPGHAAQWLQLGTTREDLGDDQGALAAYDQAVRCAPFYGQTHWQRGNLLLRLGRYEDAFTDLRLAAASNPKFLPNVIDLAWGLTNGDTNQTAALLQISNDNDRLEFARYLARKKKGKELVEQVNLLTAPLSDQNRDELIRLAFAAGSFSELYRLSPQIPKLGEVVNGSFDEPLLLNNSPFGWKVSATQTPPKLAVDVGEKADGARSLQVSFEGDWSASAQPLLSQTIVVQSGQRYRLRFAVKTKELVTGGPLRVVLIEAKKDQLLAKSDAFPQMTNDWQQMNVEFTVPQMTDAVVISLGRDSCSSSPCPIFGVVWLDEFTLEQF